MDPKLLAIPMAFIMLAAMLCWHVITAKGRWTSKLAFIVIVPAFGIAVWSAIASYKGWPTDDPLPKKGRLMWAEVHEPDPATRDPGVIYVWLVPLDDHTPRGPLSYSAYRGEPRAYELSYSRPMHEVLESAKRRIKLGRPVVLERDTRPGKRGRNGRDMSGHDAEYRAYELPPPAPPGKE